MSNAKHAFILSLYCLMRVQSKLVSTIDAFDWAMEQTVMLGGDTDTNCAIVGGVVGAFCGIESIELSKQ